MARAVLLTLPAYSHFRRTYTLFVDSLFSHTLRGLVVLPVSVTPGVVSLRLFSHALRGFVVLTRLAWARCSRGIHHARRGLFAALLTRLAWVRCSHTPCVGSLFSRYPSRPAWSLRGSSHTSCVGSLFSHALRGLVVLAVSVTPGVVSSWLFSHALRGLVVLGEWWSQHRSRG